MEQSEYPEEIWLYTPWPDHPKDVSRLWSEDGTKDGAVRYIREDLSDGGMVDDGEDAEAK